MFDKPTIKLSIHTIELLIRTHNEMRKRNPTMAEQDCNFVIRKLCEKYLRKDHTYLDII